MALANTSSHYGSLAKTLHWLTALGIFIMIPLGIVANGAASDTPEALAWKVQLFSAHKTLGITVFAVAIVRILWMFSQPKPAPLHPDRKFETFAAETVHILLYGSLVLVPLSGWVEHAATTGFAPILWPLGQTLPFVPQSPELAEMAAGAHIVLERVLVVSLLLHIAGALKHRFVDRDETLARMLPGQSARLALEGAPHSKAQKLAPLGAAVVVWIAGFGIGSGLGLFDHTEIAAPQLEAVDTEWQTRDGTIALTISQFGSAVAGGFSDWTTSISFDETVQDGVAGSVEVTIAIASISLGSVTSQALGPDYFDAASFPTAQFVADIIAQNDTHVAKGTLTIRDQTVPLEFPFDLALDGNQAQMQAAFELDRRAFGIGEGNQDPGQLGFEVVVDVSLTAER